MKKTLKALLFSAVLLAPGSALATSPVSPLPGAPLQRAMLMELCGDWQGAADQMALSLSCPLPDAPAKTWTERMLALLKEGESALMRAEYRKFSSQYAASAWAPLAQSLVADSYFFDADWEKASELYASLPIESLPASVAGNACLRHGIALLCLGHMEEASGQFAKARLYKGSNPLARFYQAYISYCGSDYRRAVADMQALPGNVREQTGADFYIASMLFYAGQHGKVIAMEKDLMRAASRISTPDFRASAEALRLLGESHHALSNKGKAQALLQQYLKTMGGKSMPSAQYILGVYAFEDGDYARAEELLQAPALLQDATGQSALLYLGQCRAREADYSGAAIYFEKSARMNFDSKVSETALYDLGAATVKGGRVPFSSATDLLEEFIDKYPGSPNASAVKEYLATGYLREHRYTQALTHLKGISHPSQQVKLLIQTANLQQGISLLEQGRPTESVKYLQEATKQGDEALSREAYLWLGDAQFKNRDYKAALKSYDKYLNSCAPADPNRPLALYDKAFTLFQLQDYKRAAEAFRTALKALLTPALKADATVRLADCLNYTGDVSNALALYRQAASMSGNTGRDYALFQAATLEGVMGNTSKKIAGLEGLLKESPESPWAASVLAELADAQQTQGNFQAASQTLARLRAQHPDSDQLRSATLSLADALADKGETLKAIGEYESLISTWPTSRQSLVAAENLENLSAQAGLLDRYVAFIKSVPQAPQPDATRLARLAYQQAMTAYEKNPADASPLEKYVADYPKSAFLPDALMELATHYYTAGAAAKALKAAERVQKEFPHSATLPQALLMQASILAEQGDKDGAVRVYETLLSQAPGQFDRQAYQGLLVVCSSPQKRVEYADAFLRQPQLSAEERSWGALQKGKALYDSGQYRQALEVLAPIASDARTQTGAEATVLLARTYLAQKNPSKAKSLMEEFTGKGSPYPEILAQGYLTLADALHASGQTPLAKEYLQALKENYPQASTEITNDINSRLNSWK